MSRVDVINEDWHDFLVDDTCTVYEALQIYPQLKAQKLYEKQLNLKTRKGVPYQMTDAQHERWRIADELDISVDIRSRGASKTMDYTAWSVYRTIRHADEGVWLSCKSGQLEQATEYYNKNPFVSSITEPRKGKFNVNILDGQHIRMGIVSTSILGGRKDFLVFDEFEDLLHKQEVDIFPQMDGLLAESTVHKRIYLGTLWRHALLNKYSKLYPCMKLPWYNVKFLVDAGMIQGVIDAKVVPDWEIKMLYECIAATPSGKLFPKLIIVEEHPELDVNLKLMNANRFGIDFGGMDTVVGTLMVDNDLYVVFELQVNLNDDMGALDFLKGKKVQSESGGYNDMDVHHAKNKRMMERIGSKPRIPTRGWKSDIMEYACGFDHIYVSRNLTPDTMEDLDIACYGDDGLYKKNKTTHPCHFLDAFFHSLQASEGSYLDTPDIPLYDSNAVAKREARIRGHSL